MAGNKRLGVRVHATRLGSAVAISALVALSGCSQTDEKTYDIGPIFPLTANKCAKYNGDESGEGLSKKCMVTKADCERAVEDWRREMAKVDDAIEFTCD